MQFLTDQFFIVFKVRKSKNCCYFIESTSGMIITRKKKKRSQ